MRSRRVALLVALCLLGLLALLGAGWVLWYEPSSLRLERHTIYLEGWRGPLLKVALAGDVHGGSPFFDIDRIDSIVAAINEAQPDIVLLAGDYVIQGVVGGNFIEPELIAESLSSLGAPLGVFAVRGNHDWWLDGERVKRAFEQAGIQVIDHTVHLQSRGESRFWLVGFGDFWEDPSDIESVLRQVSDDSPIVALTHNPDVFPDVPARVNLTLAAHTHGGQVRLPFVGTPIVPSRYGSRYARGLVQEDSKQLFVTSGLGSSILPVRFRVPPEIALIEIRAR